MKLWLKDSERRRDPAPVKTDDRKAMLVGLALWVIAGVVSLLFWSSLGRGEIWWLEAIGLGIILGLIGLVYTHVKRR